MTKLTRSQSIFVGSMLFGMLFGAGNLIFPVHMGQLAGSHFWRSGPSRIFQDFYTPALSDHRPLFCPAQDSFRIFSGGGGPFCVA